MNQQIIVPTDKSTATALAGGHFTIISVLVMISRENLKTGSRSHNVRNGVISCATLVHY